MAIITNIGIAHIEFMGSREAIAQEKGDLAASFGPDGTLILNSGDEFAQTIAQRAAGRVILAGIDRGEVQAREIVQTAKWRGVFHPGRRAPLSRGPARARLAHGAERASRGRSRARFWPFARGMCRWSGRGTARPGAFADQEHPRRPVHRRHYNANPDSTKAALRTLAELETDGRRIAVLGQMTELGAESAHGHEEVGQVAASFGIDQLIALGQGSAAIAAAARAAGLTKSQVVASAREAAELLGATTQPGDLVLVKGSRSARTERVLEEFAKRSMETRCAP